MGPNHVLVVYTPQRSKVIRRYLKREGKKGLPIAFDDLDCGHTLRDPGKAADMRFCHQCVPERQLVRRRGPA
jgi:hypothetical protein